MEEEMIKITLNSDDGWSEEIDFPLDSFKKIALLAVKENKTIDEVFNEFLRELIEKDKHEK